MAVLPLRVSAQISTTTVQGTVYRADGTPASGTLLVSWTAFTTPQNQAVAAGTESSAIGADGFVSLNLTPNASALPTGSYYTAVYHLSDGTVNQEYWVVPASANASIASVRAQLEPSTVAVQSISKAYVDSAISSLNGSWLSLAGGTMTGPLNLNTDPASANQAATKHYADQLAAAQLPLSGGTVTGPLNTRQFEGSLYADQWQSVSSGNNGIAMSLSQCLTLPYACQVLAPSLYAQTEASPWGGFAQTLSNPPQTTGPPSGSPLGALVSDNRWGVPIWITTTYPNYPSNRFEIGPEFVTNGLNDTFHAGSANLAAGLTVVRNLWYGSHNQDADQAENQSLRLYGSYYSPASSYGMQSDVWNNSNGDSISENNMQFIRGGITSIDNEGGEGYRLGLYEAQDVYRGTISSVSTTTPSNPQVCGSVTPGCWIYSATQTQGNPGQALGADQMMIDLTHADSSGTITNSNVGPGPGPGYVNIVTTTGTDWDKTFGDTTAYGLIPGGAGYGDAVPEASVTIPITTSFGTFNTSSPVCLFDVTGTRWECEPVTAASPTSITLVALRHEVTPGSYIAQGGMTGMAWGAQADELGPGAPYGGGGNGLRGYGTLCCGPVNLIRSVYPVMWNTSGGTAVIYGYGSKAGGFNFTVSSAYQQMGSGGTVTATLTGGVVTSCSASGGSGYSVATTPDGYMKMPPQLSYSLTGSGAVAPVLYLAPNGGALGACTVASGGSNISAIGVNVTPINPQTVYPLTHIISPWNPATGKVDGSSISADAPMPNGTSYFQVGNTVESPHYFIEHYLSDQKQVTDYRFGALNGGSTYYYAGPSLVSGAVYNNMNVPWLYANYPPAANSSTIGARQLGAPGFMSATGPWSSGYSLQMPPLGGAAFSVGCYDTPEAINICSQWNQSYAVLGMGNSVGGSDALLYNPTTQTAQMTAGATGANGSNPYCTETLAGYTSGGFSVTCNGKTSKLDTSGNLSLPGAVRAQGGVTGATINGEITVDGTTYTTLNAAWSAAVSQAAASGQNQTVRLGVGTFSVTGTLAEPTNGACVSLIGSAAPTVTADNTNASTVITVPSSLGGDLFSLQNTAGGQAQSCTFRDLMILANKNANHALNFQWFRGLYIDDVTVNDTTQDAFYLGESSGSHQANFEMRNVTVSYSSASFTPASRPNYGLNLQSTVLDSFVENLLVRNALQAAVYNAGGGITFELIHGFGYPYSCTTAPCNNTETNSSAADASWATNYEAVDTGAGGNMYFNTYMDSPAVAAFDLKSNGVQINGGHIQWPDTISFPNATFAEVESTVTSNLVISNVDCLNMSNTAGISGSPAGATGVWISYMGANGSAPSYSSISNLAGCGQYVQQRVAARQTAFDTAGNNSSNANFGSGQTGMTPKVFVTPLSSQANEGGVEVENFSGGLGDSFFSGFSGQASNFAVMADGTVRHTGLQTSAVFATSSTTLTKANHIVLANATTGALTLTLPSCYTAMPDGLTPTGMELTIVKTDSTGNTVQLTTTSSETISVLGSKAASYSLTATGGVTLACGPDSNWYSTEQIGGAANSLAATPSQCPAGSYATGITANGSANCEQAWRSTWYGYFGGTFGSSTNSSLGSIWSPSAAVSMTRLDIAVGTAPAGCSTWPVVGIYDGTASAWLKTVTLASGTYSYRNAVSGVAITAGHNLSMGVQTAGVGCTTNPASAQLTMEYMMNQ
jgi:hypothetical protein